VKREFSVARTPQQNGVAERKNKTLIEAARTMVLVIKPHNKTPYELIHGITPLIDFMKPFGCPVTILNTRGHLGKIVEDTLNIRFLENAPNESGNGPDWLFDVDSLTISINYVPVVVGNQTNGIARTRDNIVSENSGMKPTEADVNGASDKDGEDNQATRSEFERLLQQEKQTVHPNNTNSINTVSTPVSTAGPSFTNDAPSSPINDVEASNAFEDHLFERFSPFKNAFTLPDVPNVFSLDD
ncbi:putative ribonuclease H-like domain-containing protein, partial [Tanacetum coccineum]